jgi:hypothetical protein
MYGTNDSTKTALLLDSKKMQGRVFDLCTYEPINNGTLPQLETPEWSDDFERIQHRTL